MDEPTARPFGDELWTIEGDRVRMLGIPFGTRMTVARLPDGALWLHSPVQPTAARYAAVQSLGAVGHLVAPNKFHHRFVAPWSERFADATTWADPALARRRPDLKFDEVLGDAPPPAWGDAFAQVRFAGSKILPETVFFHRPSRSLIVTDILQNHEPSEDGWFWRTVKKADGIVAPDGGTPRDWRLTVRDKDAARRSLDVILGWDFRRLVVTHGRCLEADARPFVERAFTWLR